jgi:TPR repeat protein
LIEERTALEVKLEELAVAGNAEASFYSGVLALEFGRKLSRGAYTDEYSRSYFEKAIKHFKRASQAGVGESSWNLATMYQAGEGILASKLAAAEWYHKAGLQYLAAGRREDALACLEQIEAMNVSHPSRADLRERLFPEKKGGHNRNRP